MTAVTPSKADIAALALALMPATDATEIAKGEVRFLLRGINR